MMRNPFETLKDDETADEEDPLLRSQDGVSDAAAGRIGKEFEQVKSDFEIAVLFAVAKLEAAF